MRRHPADRHGAPRRPPGRRGQACGAPALLGGRPRGVWLLGDCLRGALLIGALLLAAPGAQAAGFTEVLPPGLLAVDTSYIDSTVTVAFDDQGRPGPLIPGIRRYEPGAGLQGEITVDARARYNVLLSQLQLGLLDSLTLALAVPLVLSNSVDPGLGWLPGDYQQTLGHPYSEDEFWQWAASMGQPRPGRWSGPTQLADIIAGARWRFDDRLAWLTALGLRAALTVMAALPTGSPPDPEELAVAGTTSWELNTQGELAIHLGLDWPVPGLGERLLLATRLFYEVFWPRRYDTPAGLRHPLLLTFAPYVGPTYRVDPGDFAGAALQLSVSAVRGPEGATWLADERAAASLPPLLALQVQYDFVRIGQTHYRSDSELWDREREERWRPGYKQIVQARLTASLLRLGVPLQLYAGYRSLTLLPGRNSRAPNALSAGVLVPVPLW